MGQTHDACMLSDRDAVRRGRGDYRYVALPQWALLMPLSDSALRVYALLLAHVNAADERREVWPQQQTLAAMLGRHRNTISRAIRELSEAGLVEVEVERYGPNRSRRRNVYVVHTTPPNDHRGPTSVAEWHAKQQPEPTTTNRRDRKRAGHPGRTIRGASGRTIRGASGRTARGAGTKQRKNELKNPPTPRAEDRSRPLAVAEVAEAVVSGIAEAASSVAESVVNAESADSVAEVAESVAEVAESVAESAEVAESVSVAESAEVSGDHTPPPPPAAVTIAAIREVLAMQRQRSPRTPRYRTDRAQTRTDARSAGS